VLIADRFRFVDPGGARLRHRQALVSSFSLETHIDADDMPSAQARRAPPANMVGRQKTTAILKSGSVNDFNNLRTSTPS
jgi:hypothetical protein